MIVMYPHSARGKLNLNNRKEIEQMSPFSARRKIMTLLLNLEEAKNIEASCRIKLETTAGTEVIDRGISGVFGITTKLFHLSL